MLFKFISQGLSRISEWTKNYSNIVIAIATIAIAFFTFTLWRATSGMLMVTQEQSKDMKTYTVAAQEAANAAKISAKVAADTLLVTHRAWCAFSDNIEIINPVSFESGKVTGSLLPTLKNSGNAPAFKVVRNMDVRVGTVEELFQYIQQTPSVDTHFATVMPPIFGSILLPGDIDRHIQEFAKVVDMSKIKNTKIAVLLTLIVMYRDEFNILHYTRQRWEYWEDGKNKTYFPAKGIKGSWVSVGLGNAAQ